VPDDRPLVEQLLDVVLYAPVGVLTTVAEHLPGVVAKGRTRLESRVTVARMVGRFAVGEARRRVEREVARAGGVRQRDEPTVATDLADASSPSPDATSAGPAPAVEELAIPGYDSLAASQVVQRLGALSPEELDAIRRYEEATRGRRTILGRIAQLRGDDSAGG